MGAYGYFSEEKIMIVFKEEEPQPLAREFLELQWLQFTAMCRIFGFRRPPINKSQFMTYAKNRHKEMGRVLKRIETL